MKYKFHILTSIYLNPFYCLKKDFLMYKNKNEIYNAKIIINEIYIA